MGGRWSGIQLQRMARRLQLNHPSASLRLEAARARMQALWKQHPELTGKKAIVSLGLKDQHLLSVYRARQLLKECRLSAAKRSSVHEKAGWWLDRRTAQRIRISAICKRHPEYTAKEVLAALGPEPSVQIRWINKIMNECWRALGRQGHRQCNGWTPERRIRQADMIRQHRPWEQATGSRTPERKARACPLLADRRVVGQHLRIGSARRVGLGS
jgi:hypothetical protein